MKFKYSNSSQAFQLKHSKLENFMHALSETFSQQANTTTITHTRIAQEATYSFEVKDASRGYHMYKSTTLFFINNPFLTLSTKIV